MIQVQEHTGFKRVEDYSLATWLEQVQECIQDGYEFDMESNIGYPTQIGSVYTCLMKPKVQKVALGATVKNVLTVKVDTTEVKTLIDAAIAEVKELQVQSEDQPEVTEDEPVVQPKVDGRKKKV